MAGETRNFNAQNIVFIINVKPQYIVVFKYMAQFRHFLVKIYTILFIIFCLSSSYKCA